jgi:hypothetical protein
MKKLISIIAVVVLVIATIFITSACKHCCNHEMCCKKECCDKCDGKSCCDGKDCKAKCEKTCSKGKCCSKSDSATCDKNMGEKKDCCKKGGADNTATAMYACPMHKDITSDKPGKCSKCGMELEKMK